MILRPLLYITLFIFLAARLSAQVQDLSETFTLTNGTITSPTGLWTTTCVGCNSGASSYFEVRSNMFSVRDNDNEGIWISKWFNVSAYGKINIYLNILGDNSNDIGDYCYAEYSVNNGAWTALTNGSNNPLLATTVLAYAQLSNLDSIRIRVRSLVSETNEGYDFDNIAIVSVEDQPGSGYRLDFDDAGAGTGDVVEIPNLTNLIGGNFTVTAWVNPDAVATAGQRIFCDDEANATDGYGFSLGDPGSGRLRFFIRSANPISLDMSNSAYYLSSGLWYHIAAVHDAANNTREIYVNGMLAASDTYTNNPGASPDALASIGGETAASAEGGNRFDGKIDEVTIWTTNLSQGEIRDMMCKKTDASSANLIAYYKFDEGMGLLARDEKAAFPGRLTNFDLPGDWAVSGAAIGNTSIRNYSGSWAGVSIYLTSADQDSFAISSIAGSPLGIHIYHVSESPNTVAGATGVGGNDHYYGVFKAFGTTPTYTARYYYRHNDAYQSGTIDTAAMVLYTRADNSVTTWTNPSATHNATSKTLTLTAQSTEFILGNSSAPLPITLATFEAIIKNEAVQLNWETLSEINNDYFTIERSSDLREFTELSRLKGAGNSRLKLQYAHTDYEPLPGISYYRLRQTDFDGKYSYSEVRSVRFTDDDGILVWPFPADEDVEVYSGDFSEISDFHLYDHLGKEIIPSIHSFSGGSLILSTRSLETGMYYLKDLRGSDKGIRIMVLH